jgi:thiamine biosynthesis lipoprotein
MGNTGFVDLQHFGMGTVMAHRLFGGRAEEALQAVQAEAVRLEGLLSRFIPESDVGRLNRSAGAGPERVSDETYEVLARAAAFSQHCPGLFDVTVGPLIDLWRGRGESREPPDGAAIRRALSLVDHVCLELSPRERTARLKKPGQSVDLGGIGKGFAADRFLEVFRRYGVTSAFTNLGGNVAALGAKPDGYPWRVGIRHPRKDGELIGAVSVADRSVVTSGDYQRCFIGSDGKRYHHILDPVTGYPAESGLVSVTVVAESSMDADALSTVLFVAGREKGLALLKEYPGTDAVLVDGDLRVTITAGLKDSFQAADDIDTEILR